MVLGNLIYLYVWAQINRNNKSSLKSLVQWKQRDMHVYSLDVSPYEFSWSLNLELVHLAIQNTSHDSYDHLYIADMTKVGIPKIRRTNLVFVIRSILGQAFNNIWIHMSYICMYEYPTGIIYSGLASSKFLIYF